MVRLATEQDLDFLEQHDWHLQRAVLQDKIQRKEVFVIEKDSQLIGWARYNLFWDLLPFLTMIHILEAHRRKGFGAQLIRSWEEAMKAQGHRLVLTSTQSDEAGQFFYRKVGYRDVGVLLLPNEAGELMLVKELA
jgi:ribosomal protein S18 acetylase RimI-like enzyme